MVKSPLILKADLRVPAALRQHGQGRGELLHLQFRHVQDRSPTRVSGGVKSERRRPQAGLTAWSEFALCQTPVLIVSAQWEALVMPQVVASAKVYDAVIVGSGAGGGMAAYVLTKAGAKCLCSKPEAGTTPPKNRRC